MSSQIKGRNQAILCPKLLNTPALIILFQSLTAVNTNQMSGNFKAVIQPR